MSLGVETTHAEAPVLVKRQNEWGKRWTRAFIVLSMGSNGQNRVSSFRTGYFKSFHQALGHRDCSQLSGTWVCCDQGRWVVAQCENLIKKVVRVWFQIGQRMKSVSSGELFTIFKNYLALGGAVSAESARSQDVKASKKKKKIPPK